MSHPQVSLGMFLATGPLLSFFYLLQFILFSLKKQHLSSLTVTCSVMTQQRRLCDKQEVLTKRRLLQHPCLQKTSHQLCHNIEQGCSFLDQMSLPELAAEGATVIRNLRTFWSSLCASYRRGNLYSTRVNITSICVSSFH